MPVKDDVLVEALDDAGGEPGGGDKLGFCVPNGWPGGGVEEVVSGDVEVVLADVDDAAVLVEVDADVVVVALELAMELVEVKLTQAGQPRGFKVLSTVPQVGWDLDGVLDIPSDELCTEGYGRVDLLQHLLEAAILCL
ncbi:hypothetical protein PspLS_04113 [Pyricularia sp. CBS 133598]|nr:hypothetical protein PspLS_04113 [Pyricularia sp. CBS 133598]